MSYPHIDQNGAITQHPKFGADEGDSAFFCGHFELLRHVCSSYHHIMVDKINPILFFPDKDGKLVRHAKATRSWIREKDRGSRDQYTSWICLFALRSAKKPKPALKDIARVLFKRVGFFTNVRKNGTLKAPWKVPDFITPEVLSILLRGLLGKKGFPLYFIFDMWLCLDVLYTRYLKNSHDISNHLAILITSNQLHPTIFSKLAIKLTDFNKIYSWLYSYYTYSSSHVQSDQVHRNPWFIADSTIFAIKELGYD